MRRHAPAEIERDERASIVGVGRTSRPLPTSSGHVDGSNLVVALVDTDIERAGGTTGALLLAGFGCPAGPGRMELAGGVFAGALYAPRVERVRAHRR